MLNPNRTPVVGGEFGGAAFAGCFVAVVFGLVGVVAGFRAGGEGVEAPENFAATLEDAVTTGFVLARWPSPPSAGSSRCFSPAGSSFAPTPRSDLILFQKLIAAFADLDPVQHFQPFKEAHPPDDSLATTLDHPGRRDPCGKGPPSAVD
ncbi:hypothetical protein [Chondromyces crocatus]|uniref:hypothetical protein n=1 Tax=Chondromyces crocatus TaxID=52 RepID=UPI001FE198F6|nr:hypothetical protein [Chondromyces crocatus]